MDEFQADSVGELIEPLSDRAWSPEVTRQQRQGRAALYARAGIERGDLVFLHRAGGLEFFGDLLALWSLGAAVAPIDPRLTTFEIETLARASRPHAAVWPSAPPAGAAATLGLLAVPVLISPAAEELDVLRRGATVGERRGLDDDALVLFTSGSTGCPKGVVHTHRSLRARWAALREHVGLDGLDRALCLLPVQFGHGLICNALYPWLAGRCLVLLPSFRPDVALHLGALVDEHEITFMSSVPALWRLVLRAARLPRRGTLARVFCGSAPLSAETWRAAREWAGAPVSNVYGLTETASWVAGTRPWTEPQDGLVGYPWGVTLAITAAPDGPRVTPEPSGRRSAEGPVWVRTSALMRGYLGRDDLTRAAVREGWLATGDVGCLDAEGRLHLRGREREEINRGAGKVYPGDVETVLEQHDGVLDSCAFGYEDELGQEEVAVAVVLRSGEGAVLHRLHAWTRDRLAAYQMPRRWYVVDEIPRTGRGKVSRAQIAARCGALRPIDPRTLGVDPRGEPTTDP